MGTVCRRRMLWRAVVRPCCRLPLPLFSTQPPHAPPCAAAGTSSWRGPGSGGGGGSVPRIRGTCWRTGTARLSRTMRWRMCWARVGAAGWPPRAFQECCAARPATRLNNCCRFAELAYCSPPIRLSHPPDRDAGAFGVVRLAVHKRTGERRAAGGRRHAQRLHCFAACLAGRPPCSGSPFSLPPSSSFPLFPPCPASASPSR